MICQVFSYVVCQVILLAILQVSHSIRQMEKSNHVISHDHESMKYPLS